MLQSHLTQDAAGRPLLPSADLQHLSAVPRLEHDPVGAQRLAADAKARIEDKTGEAFGTWRRTNVDEEYKRHWHKNFHSGDYAAMRALWGCRVLRSDGDIPEKLSGLKFESEDKVLYVKGGLPTVATTLRGVLRRSLGEAEGLRLFAEVSEKDATIYDWAARGPRVFDVCTASSDIVALCEYDIHDVHASYKNGDQPFHAAMSSQGYDGAFFTDPLIGRTPPRASASLAL